MALQGLLGVLNANQNLSVLKLDNIDWRDLKFPNDESYRGGWKNSRPEGEGCYTWADGSTYEGAWHAGLKHGWGTYRWPNGACYQGEWHDGFMQGYGTFASPDGARYVGNWAGNLKHGIGKKTYANGDSYEGLWRYGKADGPGRYVWHNGNQYDGEWRAGKMHGQGTLKWMTGERYDGEWQEGQENGVGVFTWRDGSTYEGFWEGGKKMGVGVFRPVSSTPGMLPGSEASTRLAAQPAQQDRDAVAAAAVHAGEGLDEQQQAPHSLVGSPTAADAPLDSPAAVAATWRRVDLLAPDGARSGGAGGAATGVGGHHGGGGTELGSVFVCAYEGGKLVHEEALSTQDLELIFGPSKSLVEKKRRLRRGRRRQVRLGETIYKGHRSYDLMLNLQLGIRYTITTLNKLPPPRVISDEHYKEKVWLKFPREGSEVTPPHPSSDFKWKDYCPTAFKHLRGLFGIDNSQYILSICGDQALREMPSPGKSGSVFFISHDDQFMIKTMHKEEIKLLLSMLPKYMRHVERNPGTLLTRFYGVHRVKPSHGRKVRFVVMNNVFRTDLDLHRKFDLKGSTHGRTAGPKPGPTAIRKDLDLDVAFHTDPKMRDRLVGQLAADCSFLEDIRVMDYSLLMGVHCRSRGETSASPLNTDKEDNAAYPSAEEGAAGDLEEEGEEGEGQSEDGAFVELEEGAGAGGGSGSSWGLVSATSASEPSARNLAGASRMRAARPSAGHLAPTSDSDADVTRSMHSLTIEQQSPRESRSPSFLLKGLTWRSFTSRRPSEPQLAPASALHPGPTQQPAPSAQITPRVQPSIFPTPRLGAAAPAAPPQLSSSIRQVQPQPLVPAFAAALRAAAAAEAAGGGAGGQAAAGAAGAAAAPAEAVTSGGGRSTQQPTQANGHAAVAEAHQQEAEQQQEEHTERSGLISWRSDAVQLPEQLMLPDGLPASPSEVAAVATDAAVSAAGGGGLDASGSLTARTRVSSLGPTLGPIMEAAGSGQDGSTELRQQGQPGEEQTQSAEAEAAAAAAAEQSAVQQQAAQTPPSARGDSRFRASSPLAAAASPVAPPSDSAASTPVSSLVGTPTAATAPRGLPLPNGVPQIDLSHQRQQQQSPQGAALQAQQGEREEDDWLRDAWIVSDWSASAHTQSEQRHSASGAGAATPASHAGSTPTPTSGHPQRRITAPPSVGGPMQGAVQAQGSGNLSSRLASVAAGFERGGLASAPATARSPLPTPSTTATGAGQQQQQQQHRLAQAGGPADALPGDAGGVLAVGAVVASPRSTRSRSGDTGMSGLARTSSAPVGQLGQQAAAAEEQQRRRTSGLRSFAGWGSSQRGSSSVVLGGREASAVDLSSPEAVALQGRINSRLSHKVTDRLVQDLLKLARYRMVGAVPHSPSARYARMPTTVLAARHMRRTSSSGGGGGSGAQREGGGGLTSSLDDEPYPGSSSAAAGGPGSTAGLAGAGAFLAGSGDELAAAAGAGGSGAAAGPLRLGMRVPAVAVSQQAGQPPEQVLLYFGIIDFLQEYNMRKMLEHSFKAVVQDGKTISVVEPRTYAKRFLRFMDRVFPAPPAQQQPQQQ